MHRAPLASLLALAPLLLLLAPGCKDTRMSGVDSGLRADSGPRPDSGPGEDAGGGTDSGGSADLYQVVFTTTAGEFVAEVHRRSAPNGADRFRELVESGFYDNTTFFRVLPGFVVQFGLSGDPATNATWVDRTIPDDPVLESNLRGSMTFATAGPDTRTTQLFINYDDNTFLDSMGFAPFARITTGMEVVDAINSEYGEAPDQSRIRAEGDDYLLSTFPNLDRILTARVR